jgi:hypothetical protein
MDGARSNQLVPRSRKPGRVAIPHAWHRVRRNENSGAAQGALSVRGTYGPKSAPEVAESHEETICRSRRSAVRHPLCCTPSIARSAVDQAAWTRRRDPRRSADFHVWAGIPRTYAGTAKWLVDGRSAMSRWPMFVVLMNSSFRSPVTVWSPPSLTLPAPTARTRSRSAERQFGACPS